MKRLSHVTPDQLLKNLLKKGWFSGRKHSNNQPWKVGVCVSGGPDSMALAYLLRHMPHPFTDGVNAFSPHALIVDHGVRDGSHQEALWVKQQLEALDIDSHIWEVRWRSDVDPMSLTGFESIARERRYRGLVTLAKKTEVDDLFTGHHEDDQVETVMLRLLRDRSLNPLSFRGMPMTSTIPTARETREAASYSTPCHYPQFSLTEELTAAEPPQKEEFKAGMRLHRPLLDYQKGQLIATCEHFKIPYVQDKTNYNPRLTFRNALRHLRTHHELPRALHSESLLMLCTRANEISRNVEEQARLLLDYVLDLKLQSETTVLSLCMKPLPSPMSEAQLLGFSFLMQRLISVVSPLKDEMLPTLLRPELTKELYTLFTSIKSSKKSDHRPSVIAGQVLCTRLSYNRLSGITKFRFSRQPISSTHASSLARFADLVTSADVSETTHWSTRWILWDERFWIKIYGEKAVLNETVVRPYTSSDAFAIKQELNSRKALHNFEQILAVNAPGNIRFTLPILVVSGKPVAFLTLNLKIVAFPSITWRVLYARNQRSTEFFFPKVSDGDEILWNFKQSRHDTRSVDQTMCSENHFKVTQGISS